MLRATLALLTFAAVAAAHGGQYRGPGDVKPVSSSSGSSTSSSSKANTGTAGGYTAPTGTTATGTSTGSAPAAAPVGVSAPRPRGVQIEDDLTRWEFWWEFGKDPYVQFENALGGVLKGSDDTFLNPRLASRARDVQLPNVADGDRVAQRLLELLRAKPTRDVASACLIALAKIGRDQPGSMLHEAFVPFLRSSDQEERETAALALGIAGRLDRVESTELLISLMQDGEAGRKACDQAGVNERTRAFAAFGLGLLLARAETPAHAHVILEALTKQLAADGGTGRELAVAVIEAIGLFPQRLTGPAGAALRDGAAAALGKFYDLPLGPGEQLLQAHVPTAIARVARGSVAEVWRERLTTDLRRSLERDQKADKSNVHVAQSCVLALGELCAPWELETDDRAAGPALLWRTYREHHDQQTRSFALLALARVGGMQSQSVLLRAFEQGNRAFEKPWAAIALGVLSDRKKRLDPTAKDDPALLAALRTEFATTKNPGAMGGLAVALGLCRDLEAADPLRASLSANAHRDDVAGYLCIGLGLMRDDRSVGPMRELLKGAERRPNLMLQAARSLGMLGDVAVIDQLCTALTEGDSSVVRIAAIASALGQIGDRRSIEPLLAIAGDDKRLPLTRAFAVVALGGVCDKDPLPWNAAYATFTNYRASTSTLTDGGAGILDIL